MKIKNFELYRYSIPLKSRLKLGNALFDEREGLVLKIEDKKNQSGFGEIAPMSGFSRESIGDAETQIKSFINSLPSDSNKDVTEHSLEGLFPSVQFGIECAMLDLMAAKRQCTVAHILSKTPRQDISINGLLAGDNETILNKAAQYGKSGYWAVKLKVGTLDLEYDIELTRQVRTAAGEKIKLRLDANRCWDSENAIKFCAAVADCNIEYLEEPMADTRKLVLELKNSSFAVPIALDETTREILPYGLSNFSGIKAIVLKPTMLGIRRTLEYSEKAREIGIMAVIGSSFESGLGLSFLAQLAAAINKEDIPAGLDTYSWFADDIIEEFLPVKNGRVLLADLPDTKSVLKSRLLKQVH